jgi:CheY-like chemotaxis protein
MSSVHVLLVEDNPADADLTREVFESGRLRVELSVAVDGVEAMALLKAGTDGSERSTPDLILLDLNLPRMSGQQTLAEIKTDHALKHIPVVVLTSSDAESDVAHSYALGANCYVIKPVDLQEFQHKVSAVEDFWFSVARLPDGARTPSEPAAGTFRTFRMPC